MSAGYLSCIDCAMAAVVLSEHHPGGIRLHLSRPHIRGGAERRAHAPEGHGRGGHVAVSEHHRALGGGPLFAGWIIDHAAGPVSISPHPRAALTVSTRSRHRRCLATTGWLLRALPALAAARRPTRRPSPRRLRGARSPEAIATRQRHHSVTIGFYAWGAFHYVLATFGLAAAGSPRRRRFHRRQREAMSGA